MGSFLLLAGQVSYLRESERARDYRRKGGFKGEGGGGAVTAVK